MSDSDEVNKTISRLSSTKGGPTDSTLTARKKPASRPNNSKDSKIFVSEKRKNVVKGKKKFDRHSKSNNVGNNSKCTTKTL